MDLNEKEIFLLHYLRNRKIEWKIDEPVKDLFENYNLTFSKLKQNGYLKDDKHTYFLETMNTAKLKEILKLLSLSVSGGKRDLIERIITYTTEIKRAEICPDLYYVLTEKALIIDEEFIAKTKAKNTMLKESMYQEIKEGNLIKASLLKASDYAKRPMPPGIGIDWNDTEHVIETSQKQIDIINEFDFTDLKNSNPYINLLKKTLYYDSEIENQSYNSIEKFIIPFEETLNCPDLDDFFQRKTYLPSEIHKVFVYLDTKRFNVFQLHQQKFFKNEKYQPLPAGEFKVTYNSISLWKEFDEYKMLSQKGISGFPKTFQTFQKHKHSNSEKYKNWILLN